MTSKYFIYLLLVQSFHILLSLNQMLVASWTYGLVLQVGLLCFFHPIKDHIKFHDHLPCQINHSFHNSYDQINKQCHHYYSGDFFPFYNAHFLNYFYVWSLINKLCIVVVQISLASFLLRAMFQIKYSNKIVGYLHHKSISCLSQFILLFLFGFEITIVWPIILDHAANYFGPRIF